MDRVAIVLAARDTDNFVAGLRDSVEEFQRSVPGTTAKDVMNLVPMTQYFDTLK